MSRLAHGPAGGKTHAARGGMFVVDAEHRFVGRAHCDREVFIDPADLQFDPDAIDACARCAASVRQSNGHSNTASVAI